MLSGPTHDPHTQLRKIIKIGHYSISIYHLMQMVKGKSRRPSQEQCKQLTIQEHLEFRLQSIYREGGRGRHKGQHHHGQKGGKDSYGGTTVLATYPFLRYVSYIPLVSFKGGLRIPASPSAPYSCMETLPIIHGAQRDINKRRSRKWLLSQYIVCIPTN